MTRSDTPRQLSLPMVEAAMVPCVVVHRSTADEELSDHDPVVAHEVIRRGVQASRRHGAMVGGFSG